MVVGILRLTLSIPGARSLKDKRQVLRKLLDRARARYNASIAEVGDNELWQRAQVGFAVVANDRRFVDEVLSKMARDAHGSAEALVLAEEKEIESYSEMGNVPAEKPNLDPTQAELEAADWDLEAEEKALAAAEPEASSTASNATGEGASATSAPHADDVGGGDAGESSGWLTESDFDGETHQ